MPTSVSDSSSDRVSAARCVARSRTASRSVAFA